MTHKFPRKAAILGISKVAKTLAVSARQSYAAQEFTRKISSALTAVASHTAHKANPKTSISSAVAAFCLGAATLCLAPTNAAALEFNELGHKATAMGGVGVAVQNNPYALFYNPALIASNPSTRFGYGLGGSFAEKNILDVFNYDFNKISGADIDKFNALLNENFANIKAQGALAFKIPDVLPFGQLSVGFAYNAYATANFTGQLRMPNNLQEALDIIKGASTPIYLNTRRVDVMEIPVSYAAPIETPIGELSIGAALKFMNAKSKLSNRALQLTDNKDDVINDLKDTLKGSGASSASNVGLDLGVVYKPLDLGLSVGLTAKYLNAPSFKFGTNGELKIKPQARLGVDYSPIERLSIAADIDLTSNELVSASDAAKVQKSQKAGVGVAFDMLFFGARAGVAKDFRQDNGAILSAGLGFGFLDLGVAVATEKTKVNGSNYPRYFALTLGGGFSF